MRKKRNLHIKFILSNLLTNDKINAIDDAIIECIKSNKYITIPELSVKINKSNPTIYRHIDELVSKNIIKHIGSRKTGYWELIE